MLSLSWSNNNLIFSYLQELSRDLEDEDLNDVDVAMPSCSTGQMHENITRKENILKSNTGIQVLVIHYVRANKEQK